MTDKLNIVFNGVERELLMSYGLLNELTKIAGSPEIAPRISIEEGLRAEVLAACLADRKPSGKILNKIEDIDDLDVSLADVEAILDWATEAVLSFFVRSLGKMVKQVEANKDVLEGLRSSVAGLNSSASATA